VVLLVAAVVGFVAYSYSQAASVPHFPFPCLQNEGLFYHVHPWLRITINGENVTIPAAVGIENPLMQQGIAGGGPNSCFEPLHTHDSSGIIHIESSTNTSYTLSDFFSVWSATYHTVTFGGVQRPVVFNSTDILGFRANTTHRVVLLVDGRPSHAFGGLSLVPLDYCDSQNAHVSPCYPTAPGNPVYGPGTYPFETGNTIVIEYTSST
jgi:hypothetical protein